MNNKYLVTYRLDDETYAEMANTGEIGELYGFSDFTDVRDVRVFRINEDGTPVELDIDPVWGDTAIILRDRWTDEEIDSCWWMEH